MIKRTIEYIDFDGNKRTEDAYFNLSKVELIEIEKSIEGGLSNSIKKAIEDDNIKDLLYLFKDIILKSYGEKSEDGRRFIKSKELSEEFSQTVAFEELYFKLATDSAMAAEFINGVIPNIDNIKPNTNVENNSSY